MEREKQIRLVKDIISDIKETIEEVMKLKETVNDIKFSEDMLTNELKRVNTFLTMCGAQKNSEELLKIYEERLKKLESEE